MSERRRGEPPACHPDHPHYAKGLCGACYQAERYRSGLGGSQSPAQHRSYNLKSSYGITVEEYEAQLAAQGGVCAICGYQPKSGGRRLAVEHNHRTRALRGLCCWRCNTGIEQFRDQPALLRSAAIYLENPPWEQTQPLSRISSASTVEQQGTSGDSLPQMLPKP